LVFTDSNGAKLDVQGVVLQDSSGAGASLGTQFQSWLKPGTIYHVAAVTWEGVSFPASQLRSTTFVVHGPESISIVLPVYNLSVRVSDYFGYPISGAQLFLNYADGAQFYAVSNAEGAATLQVPQGQYSADVYYLGMSSHLSAGSDSDGVLRVTVALSYPILLSVWVFAVLLTATVLMRRSRRRITQFGTFEQPYEV
jgi:hypothetical protein